MDASQTPHGSTSQQHGSGYAFPILKPNIILQCATELGVELTQKELTEPHRHKDRLRKVFIQFIDLLLGISEDALYAIPQAILEHEKSIQHAELYEEAISDLKYQRSVTKLMKLCGVHDFGLKDLHSPKATRFQKQLSGLINVAKYREDRLVLYGELHEERLGMFKALEETRQEQESLTHSVEKLRIENAENSKKVQELNSEQYEIEVELARKNKLQASLRNESKLLTKQADELKYQIATIGLAVQETEDEEYGLKSAIVKSPEKVQFQLEQLKGNVEDEKAECYNAEKEVENAKLKVENVDDAMYQAKKFNEVVGDVILEIDKYKNVVADVQSMRKSNQALEERLKGFREQNVNADQLLTRNGKVTCLHPKTLLSLTNEHAYQIAEEKFTHMKKLYQERKKAVLESLESARYTFSIVHKENHDGIARIEAADVEVRSLENKLEEERKEHDNDIKGMVDAFYKFAAQLEAAERQFMDHLIIDS